LAQQLLQHSLGGLTVLASHKKTMFDFGSDQHEEIGIICSDRTLCHPCDRVAG
jgi:hypothetical protein